MYKLKSGSEKKWESGYLWLCTGEAEEDREMGGSGVIDSLLFGG